MPSGPFMPAPSITLPDESALRAALEDTSWMNLTHPGSWLVRSQYLIDLIYEISRRQFPYNSDVQREAEKRLGIPQQDDNGSPLSRLVYNAQGFRRSDELRAEGFEPLTADLLRRAFDAKSQIELQGENALGLTVRNLLNVREIRGNLYAMKPRAKKYAVSVQGQPARVAVK